MPSRSGWSRRWTHPCACPHSDTKGGIDNYLQVLDAQRSLFQGELELARLRQQELGSIVQLYRALGGGWNPGTAAVVDAGRTS